MSKVNKIQELKKEISKVIVGQEEVINKTLIAMLAGGNLLLEGAPGLAKTLLVNTLAKSCSLDFSRIQFTPDLLPSDILGTKIFNQKTGDFVTKKGPIFTNFLLADEINRAPPKTQSSLLEAMQEKQISILGDTFELDKPFLVMATQNPIEQEGTYLLPEAQVDRFMMKLIVDYPTKEDEIEILNRMTTNEEIKVNHVLEGKDILKYQKQVKDIYVDDLVKEYVVSIIDATRNPEKYDLELGKYIKWGASPRANIWTILGAKANAFMNEREYVNADDVKEVITDILRHRIILTYEAEIDRVNSSNIIDEILKKIKSP
ncbi:MAG: MoxR family ATPase [Nanoarchaeota archaeon]|nr:MoxR family ATPase [Nanoarchaeota archaeon]